MITALKNIVPVLFLYTQKYIYSGASICEICLGVKGICGYYIWTIFLIFCNTY